MRNTQGAKFIREIGSILLLSIGASSISTSLYYLYCFGLFSGRRGEVDSTSIVSIIIGIVIISCGSGLWQKWLKALGVLFFCWTLIIGLLRILGGKDLSPNVKSGSMLAGITVFVFGIVLIFLQGQRDKIKIK